MGHHDSTGGTTSTNPSAGQNRLPRRVGEEELELGTSLLRGRLRGVPAVLHSKRGKGVLRVREAALDGSSVVGPDSGSFFPLLSVSSRARRMIMWKSLEGEWRGVLSFEGFDELWP